MKKLLFFSLLIAVDSVLFLSCAKDDAKPQIPDDIKVVADISNVFNQAIIDFQTMGNLATNKNLKSAIIQDNSVLPSHSKILFFSDSTMITIPFGNAGTLCGDGRFRKGTITIKASDRLYVTKIGTTLTITTENYEVDGYKIDLTKVITYQGTDVSDVYPYGFLKYSVVIDKGRIFSPKGDTAVVTINHNRNLLFGETAVNVIGWAVSGTSTIDIKPGITSKNFFSPFTDDITIIKELVKPLRYRYLISGETTHSLSSGKLITIDYGSGSVYDILTWRGLQTISSNGVTNELSQN